MKQRQRHHVETIGLVLEHEEWLIDQVLAYAKERDYTRYSSSLREAWRPSVAGLSEAVVASLRLGRDLELAPGDDGQDDPACAFGIKEAQRHRERGVSLATFLGLMKYHRQAYLDLIDCHGQADARPAARHAVGRVFDRIEIAFCSAWASVQDADRLDELERRNRLLANEKNLLLTILDSQQPAIAVLDPDGKVSLTNLAAQRLLGLGERIGQSDDRESERPPAPSWLRWAVDDFVASGLEQKTCEVCHETDDGRVGHEVAFRRLHDPNGKFEAVVVTLNPATAGKRDADRLRQLSQEQERLLDALQATQRQLLQSEKMAAVGQLAAGVAHEINNPLGYVTANVNQLREYHTSLRTYLDLLDGAIGRDEELAADPVIAERRDALDIEYILDDIPSLMDETTDGLTRVIKIVADLKGFSRRGDGPPEPCDLPELIESTVNVVWNELKYHVTLERAFVDLPPLVCHGSQISQVIMNLLVNAGHAITEQGVITLRTGRDDDAVWLEVTDDGCGMTDEVMDRIFNPFFTTKPAGQGTGLGLSVSRDIVEKHGGTLVAASEPGVGSTFRMTLPLASPLADQGEEALSELDLMLPV